MNRWMVFCSLVILVLTARGCSPSGEAFPDAQRLADAVVTQSATRGVVEEVYHSANDAFYGRDMVRVSVGAPKGDVSRVLYFTAEGESANKINLFRPQGGDVMMLRRTYAPNAGMAADDRSAWLEVERFACGDAAHRHVLQ